MFEWLYRKKEIQLTSTDIANLNRLPPDIIKRAQISNQSGDDKLLRELVELSRQDEPPTKPGMFGKVALFGKSAISSLGMGAVSAGAAVGVTYLMDGIDPAATGTEIPEGKSLDLAMSLAKKEGQSWTDITEEQQAGYQATANEQLLEGHDIHTIAMNRGKMVGAFGLGIGTIMRTIGGWSNTDKEAEQKMMLWRMMHEPSPALTAAMASPQMGGTQPEIAVPQGLPAPQQGHQAGIFS